MAERFDARQYMIDIDQFVAAAKGNTREAVTDAIFDISEQVVVRSPFKTGFLRGSWFTEINNAPIGRGRIGANALYDMQLKLAEFEVGDVVHMGNTAVYARRLEFGFVGRDSLGRNYDQPGRFWVQGVMLGASRIAIAAAERVASGQRSRAAGGGVLPDIGFV